MSSKKRGREAAEFLENLAKLRRTEGSEVKASTPVQACAPPTRASATNPDAIAVGKVEIGEKERVFQEAFRRATPGDRVWELMCFMRNLPTTLPSPVRDDLVKQVKSHLMVEGDEKLLYDLPACTFRSKSSLETPLLDALSAKKGFNFVNILAPPIKSCLKCHSPLSAHRKPSQVRLHTLRGTRLASKYILRCRHCTYRYHPTRYGNEDEGFKLFSDVPLVEASMETFVEEDLARRYAAEFLYGWLPAVAKCEAFNWANRDSYSERATKMFLKLNPEVGQRFCAKEKEEEAEEEEESLEEGEERKCLMYQMSRKSLSQTLLNFHILEELKETGYIERISFGPKVVGGKRISFKESREQFFEDVDLRRKEDLYCHEVCYDGCKRRGCDDVSTFDGLWKIQVF